MRDPKKRIVFLVNQCPLLFDAKMPCQVAGAEYGAVIISLLILFSSLFLNARLGPFCWIKKLCGFFRGVF
jgi:hypothetical protein